MKTAKAERRLHPRIQHELPLKVIANGYDFATYSQNISCVGAYCHIGKYVPPFTKVMIKMAFPGTDKKSSKSANCVECKGVIVRTEDVENGGYNIAIFFNGITDACRQKISSYISRILPQCPSASRI
ncbi:MAG: PilZ domain-containing protein [Candidatus Omnitrophica bacterium]|nr:PilZ domain-containing protein [Candidatus Omnitrophota bacterium]